MARLGEEVLAAIEAAAERIQYGDITIHLVETSNAIDIEVNERVRFPKPDAPRPGRVVTIKRPGML